MYKFDQFEVSRFPHPNDFVQQECFAVLFSPSLSLSLPYLCFTEFSADSSVVRDRDRFFFIYFLFLFFYYYYYYYLFFSSQS